MNIGGRCVNLDGYVEGSQFYCFVVNLYSVVTGKLKYCSNPLKCDVLRNKVFQNTVKRIFEKVGK